MYLSTESHAVARPLSNTPISFVSSLEPIVQIGNGDSQLQRWSSLIGIVTAIVGNILISFALNIQRYAHIKLHEEGVRRRARLRNLSKRSQDGYGTSGTNANRISTDEYDVEEDAPLRQSFHSADSHSTGCTDDEHFDEVQQSTYLRSPYWWGGIVLMTVGEAGNFLAYGFAPASIVSPLGVVALISNCVVAPIMLKERFRLRDFWGVVVAVAGAVTVVLSAKQEEKKFGPHEIWGAITTTEFEIYMAITVCFIAVLMWASPKYGNKTILIDLGLVGLFGGYTALSTKGVASMLSSTLWRALTTPVTYALLVVLSGTAIMQVRYVNRALQRFDSTQVIPVQFVLFTLSVITGSAILYRDFEKITAENAVKFIGGCLLTFFGVWLITSGRPDHNDEEEDEADAEEGQEQIGLSHQDYMTDELPQHHRARKQSSFQAASMDGLGDGIVEGQSTRNSRASSHVSFARPLSSPQSSQRAPSATRQSTLSLLPPASIDERPVSEDSPLLRNPWMESTDSLLRIQRHPGMPMSTSSPLLPSEAQAATSDTTKPPTMRSTTQSNFHTHPNHQQGPSPPQAERPTTPARHSISRLLPGPLLSPLSGGLSVVIADSLRRGLDSPRSKPSKRPSYDLRKTRSGSQRLIQTSASDGAGEADDVHSTPNADETSEQMSKSQGKETGMPLRTRARSLSNTIGDFFKGKRSRRGREDDEDEDEDEAGPSRS